MNIYDFISMSIPITINENKCIHAYSGKSTCQKCIRHCPVHGISLVGHKITVEECIGCGRCIQQCPQQVFEMDFQRLLSIPKADELIIACRKAGVVDYPVIETNCLQQFNITQLAMLSQKFSSIIMYCDNETCERCESQWYPEGQKILLGKYGFFKTSERIKIIRDKKNLQCTLEKNQQDINNRRLFMKNHFQTLKNTSTKYVEQTANAYTNSFIETISSKSLTFQKSPSQSMLIHQSIVACEEDGLQEIPLEKLDNIRCRFCGACESICPWEAIALIKNEDDCYLAHHDVLCARCNLCIDICPENGLLWGHGLNIHDLYEPKWRVLKSGIKKICEKCGEEYYTLDDQQERCIICRNK